MFDEQQFTGTGLGQGKLEVTDGAAVHLDGYASFGLLSAARGDRATGQVLWRALAWTCVAARCCGIARGDTCAPSQCGCALLAEQPHMAPIR